MVVASQPLRCDSVHGDRRSRKNEDDRKKTKDDIELDDDHLKPSSPSSLVEQMPLDVLRTIWEHVRDFDSKRGLLLACGTRLLGSLRRENGDCIFAPLPRDVCALNVARCLRRRPRPEVRRCTGNVDAVVTTLRLPFCRIMCRDSCAGQNEEMSQTDRIVVLTWSKEGHLMRTGSVVVNIPPAQTTDARISCKDSCSFPGSPNADDVGNLSNREDATRTRILRNGHRFRGTPFTHPNRSTTDDDGRPQQCPALASQDTVERDKWWFGRLR